MKNQNKDPSYNNKKMEMDGEVLQCNKQLQIKKQQKKQTEMKKKVNGKNVMQIAKIACIAAMMIFVACNKQDNVLEEQVVSSEQEIPTALEERSLVMRPESMITYYSTPTVGGYSPNSSSSVPLKMGRFTVYGGVIRAQVIRQHKNAFIIRVSKQDGGTFQNSASIRIGAGFLAGGFAGGGTIQKGSRYGDVVIKATFQKGYVHFYPMVSSGGTFYYAEPILIYTSPMYTIKSNYTEGEEIGTANGVIVKAAGAQLHSKENLEVQCTEFCSRYYQQVYKTKIINTGQNGGHATTWYSNASAKGLAQIAHGSQAPRPGDILCMSGGAANLGHVAIVMEVSGTYIKVAQQNGGLPGGVVSAWHPIGGELSYNASTKRVTPPIGYTIDGFLRMPN